MSRPRNPTARIIEPRVVTRKIEKTYCISKVKANGKVIEDDVVIEVLGFFSDKRKLEKYLNRKKKDWQNAEIKVKQIYHKVFFAKMDIEKFQRYADEVKEIKKEI